MNSFLPKDFDTVDLIAIIFFLTALYLKAHGANGEVSMVITLIVGYYFGRRTPIEEKNVQ